MRSRFLRERTLQRLHDAMTFWDAVAEPVPPRGWLRATRIALGMSSRRMAQRLGVSQSAVEAAQRAEAGRTISLDTLERYAAALECTLVYVLVPREGALQEIRERRAEVFAFERVWLDWSACSRDVVERDEMVQRLKAGLLFGQNPAKLWRDFEIPVRFERRRSAPE